MTRLDSAQDFSTRMLADLNETRHLLEQLNSNYRPSQGYMDLTAEHLHRAMGYRSTTREF
ncbi:MAG: hypothetical protein ACO3GW_08715 [Vulcanococcus sp.]